MEENIYMLEIKAKKLTNADAEKVDEKEVDKIEKE